LRAHAAAAITTAPRTSPGRVINDDLDTIKRDARFERFAFMHPLNAAVEIRVSVAQGVNEFFKRSWVASEVPHASVVGPNNDLGH
jgi:hypothetical protein